MGMSKGLLIGSSTTPKLHPLKVHPSIGRNLIKLGFWRSLHNFPDVGEVTWSLLRNSYFLYVFEFSETHELFTLRIPSSSNFKILQVFKKFRLETLELLSSKKWLSSWNLYTIVAQLHELFLFQSFSCLQPLYAGFTAACRCTCLFLLCMVRKFPTEPSLYSFNHM